MNDTEDRIKAVIAGLPYGYGMDLLDVMSPQDIIKLFKDNGLRIITESQIKNNGEYKGSGGQMDDERWAEHGDD